MIAFGNTKEDSALNRFFATSIDGAETRTIFARLRPQVPRSAARGHWSTADRSTYVSTSKCSYCTWPNTVLFSGGHPVALYTCWGLNYYEKLTSLSGAQSRHRSAYHWTQAPDSSGVRSLKSRAARTIVHGILVPAHLSAAAARAGRLMYSKGLFLWINRFDFRSVQHYTRRKNIFRVSLAHSAVEALTLL